MLAIDHVTFTYVSEFADDEIATSELDEPALTDVSLEVKPGTCTLLVGPSGSGKTSLSRLCNGIIPQYHPGVLQGDILWNGQNMVTMPLAELSRHIGSVFQNPRSQFFCTDTTNEIAFACENFCMSQAEILERVWAARDTFHLDGLLGRNIFRLSGGQKQRIACGSVWAYEPDLYVFDEPSSNLDLASIEELREIMTALKAQGAAIVIAEHRIFYLRDLVDSVCAVHHGRITARYTPQEFSALSFEQRTSLGMRVRSLDETARLLPIRHPEQSHVGSEAEVGTSTERQLEVRNLDVRMNSSGLLPTRILDIDRLDLPIGQVIALVGPNGAGKSTFARSLVELQRTRHGTFHFEGRNCSAKERSRMSYMVMQDVEAQLFTDSVFNEVTLSMNKGPRSSSNVDQMRQSVMDLFQRLDLAEFADRHPLSLSGGQQQRVVIACAIASDARIVVFDEPTSGLDFLHMKEVAQLVDDLADPSRITLVITHDVEFIALCCTRVVEMKDGRIHSQYAVDQQGLQRVITTLT